MAVFGNIAATENQNGKTGRNTLRRKLATMVLFCCYAFCALGTSTLLLSASSTAALARGGGGGGGHEIGRAHV